MTVNHDVVGSSPTCGVFIEINSAALAQQVERHHGKVESRFEPDRWLVSSACL